jgi:hypothetical protein
MQELKTMNNVPMSFYQYALDHTTSVPIIQRDYAQGRNGPKVKQVLQRFLSALKESLNNNTPLSLAFIYGMEKADNDFLPIDGQQRLTTLFLLHWFTALQCDKLADFIQNTKKFSYQTRSAAIDFFGVLQSVDKIQDFKSIKSGSEIKNFNWFNMEWNYDPTVKSVIEVLDRMYEIYQGIKFSKWWDNLTSNNCPVTFLYVPINKTSGVEGDNAFENESRAAATYIKMNARGKHLSQFENMKSLIHSIGTDGEKFANDYDSDYIKKIEHLASLDDTTKNNLARLSSLMDDMMMQFLINIYNDLYLLTNEDDVSEKILCKDYYSFSDAIRKYAENKAPEYPMFDDGYFPLIHSIFSSKWNDEQEKALINYCKNDQRPSRLRFAAIFLFVWKCGFNETFLSEWKYVLDNFHIFDSDANTNIILPFGRTMHGLFSLVIEIKEKKLMPIDYIAQAQDFKPFSAIPSVKPLDWREEHIKAKIILENDLPYDYFKEIQNLFDKRIRAFLFMSGFWNGNGNKEKLDTYIDLAKRFELKHDTEPPLELVKLFYLFATGVECHAAIKEQPHFDKSLFCWDNDTKSEVAKLKTLASVFDFLQEKQILSRDCLIDFLEKTAQQLYSKKDWRAFALVRNENILFNHLQDDKLIVDQKPHLIFSLVKKLDLHGEYFSQKISYKRTESFGEVGENTISHRRITLENSIHGIISIEIPKTEEYSFYTESENNFTIYCYNGFDGSVHKFECYSFDIKNTIGKYKALTEKIKKIILARSDKNAVLTNIIRWQKEEIEKACSTKITPDICKLGHYYNRVIVSFEDNSKIIEEETERTVEKLQLQVG